jgi:uncharacterized membrane protein YdcZ (DUF606 family)
MERDLIVGYVLIKVSALLGIYGHQGAEPVKAYLMVIAVTGGLAGAFFIWRSWNKARNFAK